MEIIYEKALTERPEWALPTLIVALIIMAICYVGMKFLEGDWNILATMAFIFAGFMVVIGFSALGMKVPSERSEYTVLVDRNADMSIFDDYEIVEKTGQLWIIRDKEV